MFTPSKPTKLRQAERPGATRMLFKNLKTSQQAPSESGD